MFLTVPQVLAARPEALSSAADSVGASVGTLETQIGDERSLLARLADGWDGRASAAAQEHAQVMLAGQERHRDQLRSLEQAMTSGGQELTDIRAQLQTAVDEARSAGWVVADDGSVTTGPILDQLAVMSPAISMELALMGMQLSSQIKTKLAEFTWADLRTAAEIRKFDDTPENPAGNRPPEVPPQPDPAPEPKHNPADIAEQLLGRNASELRGSGELPMNANVPDDVCCANFVTATLQKAGLIDWHSDLVSETSQRLQAQGWRVLPASQTRPGDVAIINGNQHTELVSANDNGAITLIGSNNINPDGSQQISHGHPYGDVVYLSPP